MPDLAPESVVFSRYLDPAEKKQLQRRHRDGDVVLLHRGAYAPAALWGALDSTAKHRASAMAVALHFNENFVFSHLTAAAFWRLPRIGQWPAIPHIAGALGHADRTASFVRHGLGVPSSVVSIDGVLVAGLAATTVDVAASVGFAHGVAVADAALRRTTHAIAGTPRAAMTRDDLFHELARVPATHGASRARRVIEFADGRADRPGESLSRVSMHLCGVTAPELQVPMVGASGKEYVVDFWWEKFNLIGEFDGKYKYTDPEYMNGRSAGQVLYDEKLREDDLRAALHGFTRWPWTTAISPTLLRTHLTRAGVR